MLTGGSRTALPRQQTLRSLIDWSHSLLTEPERLLLRRLSVFAGGWTLEAAEEVCKDDARAMGLAPAHLGPPPGGQPHGLKDHLGVPLQQTDVLDLLTRLVDKSLVISDEQATEPRYRMLETIRQYAQERLLESGEDKRVRERHLDFFMRLAEEAEPKLLSPEQEVWMNRLEMEHDNLRAAIECARTSDQAAASLRLAGALRCSGFGADIGVRE